MSFDKPKVVIAYLLWADEPEKYLERAFSGIAAQTFGRENLELLIIYNSHRQGEPSSATFIKNEIVRQSVSLPHTTFLEQEKNLGFSGGNNLCMRWAMEHGFDYVFLHNADGFLHAEAIERLVDAMEGNESIGAVQPLILLYPKVDLINSAGNALHYLGMGYCAGENQPVVDFKFPPISDIGYGSGAALMLRADLLKKFGAWKEEFFLYHEDTEYSLRLKFLGYRIVLAGKAVFYHQYDFKKSASKFFWIERNRHAIKLLFYKWPTLILLAPLEVAYNLGLMIASLRGGWIQELFNVYRYWLSPVSWKLWLNLRNDIQSSRKISDKEFLGQTVATVISPSGKGLIGGFLNGAANTIFTIYGFLLKLIVRW